MITPPPLKSSDTVAIISTARKITTAELQPAISWLEEKGLKVKLGKTIGAAQHQFAGNDQLRAQDLQAMIDDEGVRAIWFARGGYGTVRIIDAIDCSKLQRQPKWLIGYSDLSVILNHVSRQLGLISLHATMPVNVATNTPEALDSLWQLLQGNNINYNAPYHNLNRTGTAQGGLVGGNLSVLYSLTGSRSFPETDRKSTRLNSSHYS